MIISERSKAIALRLANPNRVFAAVPSAKELVVKGHKFVVVPHEVENVATLRTLGIEAPSPILHHYDWPGRFKPFDHQKETAAFLTVHKKCLVLNDLGTGKTMSALWAADYLMKQGLVKKVLIISPLSTLERVWGDAIFTDFIARRYVVLHGDAKRRSKRLKADVDFYIVNHDGFSVIAPEAHGKFDLVIVDEAAVLRGAMTRRFKVFRAWMDKNPDTRLWLMTGTPTPNEPTDAWALARLVESPYIPPFYTHFRDQVMYKEGMHKWLPRPNAIETVRHVLQPSIRFARDDCLDLPPTMIQSRHVDLTPEQKKHFEAMTKDLLVELSSGETITALNQAIKLQKLVQLACGVAYGDDGENIEVDCAPRVAAVREVIEQTDGKVIVFVPLTGTLRMLERELSKQWSVAVVNGAVSSSARNQIFHDFQNTPNPRVLIAHPATMAHGLTLTAATAIVWYGPITSNEQYVQANGRVERPGKRGTSTVVHIEATAVERKIYKRLAAKQSLQGLLLEVLKDQDGG